MTPLTAARAALLALAVLAASTVCATRVAVVIMGMGIDKEAPFVGSVERLNKTGGVCVPVD
jgi:hypothetical protein